jgi:hypothetical protein
VLWAHTGIDSNGGPAFPVNPIFLKFFDFFVILKTPAGFPAGASL